MGGNKIGGLKAKEKNLKTDPDFYHKIGRKGGLFKGVKGFAAMSKEQRAEAGRKGGTISRRNKPNAT